jgi:hypothetical protein
MLITLDEEEGVMRFARCLAACAAIATGLLLAASPAGAADICLGSAYGKLTPEQQRGLEAEVRKRGGLKTFDKIVVCDVAALQKDAKSEQGKARKKDPAQAKSCVSRCETLIGAIKVACPLVSVPGVSLLCGPISDTGIAACKADCERRYGPAPAATPAPKK